MDDKKLCEICKGEMIKVYTDDYKDEFVYECPDCEVDTDIDFENENVFLQDDDGGFNDDDGEHGIPDKEFLKWKNTQDGRKGH